ncbi:sporulation histidine kinase inhibitor Sda [Alteribacillus iranensis]|uniref:Developmental checkpoint coupling sporulation initiation to replication initiation n=1 Tax=Alteribacillus iranensis TaxID=930128 RepID=A0A1I1ZCL6_9BACI|nr:sporulation histidine kinase inhibitor Sda [Alteribacillus iranensis]SFE28233.1 developmental checkpoint coupling sporulation initiation to replication initiation [Alteribacillus iranensis]
MEQLSDDLLVEAYEKAIQLELEDDFVTLIEKELRKRSLLMGNYRPVSISR